MVSIQPSPPSQKVYHPSDVINRFLLDSNSRANVAITHDSEWTNAFELGEGRLLGETRLLKTSKIDFMSNMRAISCSYRNVHSAHRCYLNLCHATAHAQGLPHSSPGGKERWQEKVVPTIPPENLLCVQNFIGIL
ncbi:hypothetical protein BDN67DRAFT_967635 [Paxillus ammoniavirescens]|nr:hypothetical protein BDN67DRAFT_967635 [Paxillus ammoniavirescens]